MLVAIAAAMVAIVEAAEVVASMMFIWYIYLIMYLAIYLAFATVKRSLSHL